MFIRSLRALFFVCLISLPASAAVCTWNNSAGGNYATDTNWDPVGSPGSDDRANFELDSITPYVVNITGNYQVGRFSVKNDNVIFAVAEVLTTTHTGDTNSCAIGTTDCVGTLTITGGGMIDASSIGKVDIAMAADSTGSLTVSNGVLLAQQFSVGAGGDGTLLIESDGAVGCVKGIIGSYPNAVGHATVDGGSWDCSGIFVIGWDNVGYLTAQNGATLTQASGKDAYLGYKVGTSGTATIDGADTTWAVGGALKIGDEGFGDLTVSNQAALTAPNITLGSNTTGRGFATVDGTGTTWTVGNTLKIGNNGFGDLTISNEATVTAPTVLLGANATGRGFATINGGKLLPDALALGGDTGAAQGMGLMTIKNGAVTVTGTTTLWDQGYLNLQGGMLTTDAISCGGSFNWTGGTLEITGTGGLKIGTGYDLDSVILTGDKRLNVTNTLVIKDGGVLTIGNQKYQAAALRLNNGVVSTIAGQTVNP